MNLEIKKIRLKELRNFVNSEEFAQFTTIPITPERAESYIHNPHARPDDVILYLGYIEKKLVAFRTLFADVARSEKEQIRFSWCSGNWVHPDYRRLGFSEKLLNEAFSDWNKKLMFTNYAPNSENLYLKTGAFKSIHQFEGVRAYLFPKTRKLIAAANKNKITKTIFSSIDFIISIFSSCRLLFYSEKMESNFRFETLETPDEQCYSLVDKNATLSCFDRNRKVFEWIFQFPWISKTNLSFKNSYPFSSFSDSFKYQTIKIFRQNNFVGFFIFSIRDGHLKTLYFNTTENVNVEISEYLKRYCYLNKIEMLTIYNLPVSKEIFKRKFPFLHQKRYGQKIYCSFDINIVKRLHFQDGDGDVIFT